MKQGIQALLNRVKAFASEVRGAASSAVSTEVAEGEGTARRGGASLDVRLYAPMIISGLAVLLFFGVFGAWSATARLASGAAAPGVISPEGARQTVQHLEGGMVEEILVRDGDAVAPGQPLVVLAKTQAQVGFDINLEQRRSLTAVIARLEAERDGLPAPAFPAWLMQWRDDPDVAQIIETQLNQFRTRRAAMEGRQDILRQRVAQLEEQIGGFEAQIASQTSQLALIDEEIADIQTLVDKGLERKSRLSNLKRAKAEIEGAAAENRAAIAQARQAIGEAELQILNMADTQRADIARELERVTADLAAIRQQMIASEDVLDRTVVTAPTSGVIVNMRVNTSGGVLKPGDPVLDIVPAEEDLIIEARVSPLDIDVVRRGLEATVTLSAFSQRTLPRIGGVVRSVSADALTDPVTGESYFKAVVKVDRAQMEEIEAEIGASLDLVPGMPADVLIVTGHRTFLQYVLEPFGASIRRSFREV